MKSTLKFLTAFIILISFSCSGLKKRDTGGFGGGWNIPAEKVKNANEKKTAVEKVQYATEKQVSIEYIKYSKVDKKALKVKSDILHDRQEIQNNTKIKNGINNKTTAVYSKKYQTNSKRKNGNLYFYLSLTVLATAVFGSLMGFRKKIRNVTKFASSNPKKAKLLITAIQLLLSFLGLMAGYNFHKMGYSIELTHGAVLSLLGLTFFSFIPFLKKNSSTIMPGVFLRRRAAMLAISMASFGTSGILGNNLSKIEHVSSLNVLVEKADAKLINTVNSALNDQSKLQESELSVRNMAGVGITILAVILTLILLALTCVGFCLVIGAWGVSGFFPVVGGMILVSLCLWAIKELWEWA